MAIASDNLAPARGPQPLALSVSLSLSVSSPGPGHGAPPSRTPENVGQPSPWRASFAQKRSDLFFFRARARGATAPDADSTDV